MPEHGKMHFTFTPLNKSDVPKKIVGPVRVYVTLCKLQIRNRSVVQIVTSNVANQLLNASEK